MMAGVWKKKLQSLISRVKQVVVQQLPPEQQQSPKSSKVVGEGEAQTAVLKCSCKERQHTSTCHFSMWEALQTGYLLPVTTFALPPKALPGVAQQSQSVCCC